MAGKACDFDDMPTHPSAKRVTGHGGKTNSFVKGGGKGKKKGRKKRVK